MPVVGVSRKRRPTAAKRCGGQALASLGDAHFGGREQMHCGTRSPFRFRGRSDPAPITSPSSAALLAAHASARDLPAPGQTRPGSFEVGPIFARRWPRLGPPRLQHTSWPMFARCRALPALRRCCGWCSPPATRAGSPSRSPAHKRPTPRCRTDHAVLVPELGRVPES